MQLELKIKPLSVNEAFQGRRFKTNACKAYEQELLYRLPRLVIPKPPYQIKFDFGVGKLSDYDNLIKVTQDVLCKKYEFDDRDIYEAIIRKVVVKKGEEFLKVKLESIV
jgi:Holliday junction resolvase RusA-like endonuclease